VVLRIGLRCCSPTITIFPGAVIDVFCNKDLILPGAYHENAGINPVIVQR